jgi:hypothetical protein
MSFFSSESSHDPSGVKCRPSNLNPATITCRHGAVLTAHSGSHDAGAALFEDYNLRAAATCRPQPMPNAAIPERNGTGRCATPRAPRPIPLLRRANKAQINPGLRSSLDESRGSGHIANILKSAHVVTCCASFCVRTQRALMTSSESTSSGRRAAFATTQKSFLQSPRSACFRAAVLQ